MKHRAWKEWAIRLVLLLLGLTVAHLGVTLFLQSDLGSDPFSVLVQGISMQVGLSFGTTHVIVTCALMAIMLVTTRGYVLPGTVVCAFCGGPIIDAFTWLLGGFINASLPMALRVASSVVGCVILAAGMSLVIRSDAGTGPNDLVAVILADKLKRFQFRWVRMTCDAVFMVVGFVLGGTVGLGTVLAVFLIGPVVQWFLPRSQKIVERCIRTMPKVS